MTTIEFSHGCCMGIGTENVLRVEALLVPADQVWTPGHQFYGRTV